MRAKHLALRFPSALSLLVSHRTHCRGEQEQPSTAMASVTVLLKDPMQNGNDAAEARARIVAALKTVDEARATGKRKMFSKTVFSLSAENCI